MRCAPCRRDPPDVPWGEGCDNRADGTLHSWPRRHRCADRGPQNLGHRRLPSRLSWAQSVGPPAKSLEPSWGLQKSRHMWREHSNSATSQVKLTRQPRCGRNALRLFAVRSICKYVVFASFKHGAICRPPWGGQRVWEISPPPNPIPLWTVGEDFEKDGGSAQQSPGSPVRVCVTRIRD